MRFNPRPREGATGGLEQFRQVFHVSIHAPVKGRPDELMAVYRGETVSIHAPVKGRRGGNLRQGLVRGFNPRPREGATARP